MSELEAQEGRGKRPFRIHALALGAGAAVVILVIALYFLRAILGFIEAYHQIYVVAFLLAFALWCYWVVVALVRRRLALRTQTQPP